MTDELSVTSEGVAVRKAFDADSFPVPAIAFEIESTRDDAVDFALVDEIPESFPMDHVGFHPDFESDNWTAFQDHRVQYQRTLEPGESVTTVFGIRIDDPGEADAFLEEPRVQVQPSGTGPTSATEKLDGVEAATTDVVPSESTDLVREAIAGDRETVPGLDADDDADDASDTDAVAGADDGPAIPEYDPIGGDVDEPDVEPDLEPGRDRGDEDIGTEPDDAPATDETASGPGVASGDDDPELDLEPEGEWSDEPDVEADSGGADDAPAVPSTPDESPEPDEPGVLEESVEPDESDDGLAAALAAEVRAGDVADDDLATLADALGDRVASPSTETRIDHLQARVSDLEAYADALEAFIDANGTAREVLDDLQTDVADLGDRVDTVEAVQERAEADRNGFRSDLDALTAELEAIDAMADDLADVRHELANVSDDVSDVRDGLDDLQTVVDSLREWRHQLSDVLGG